jgi:uncharacterized membrane protein
MQTCLNQEHLYNKECVTECPLVWLLLSLWLIIGVTFTTAGYYCLTTVKCPYKMDDIFFMLGISLLFAFVVLFIVPYILGYIINLCYTIRDQQESQPESQPEPVLPVRTKKLKKLVKPPNSPAPKDAFVSYNVSARR